jgi:hypothetical protein
MKADAEFRSFLCHLASTRKPPTLFDSEKACRLYWWARVHQHNLVEGKWDSSKVPKPTIQELYAICKRNGHPVRRLAGDFIFPEWRHFERVTRRAPFKIRPVKIGTKKQLSVSWDRLPPSHKVQPCMVFPPTPPRENVVVSGPSLDLFAAPSRLMPAPLALNFGPVPLAATNRWSNVPKTMGKD